MTRPEDVLWFWLGEPGADPLAKSDLWFKKNPAFDREITERFQSTLEAAVRGELASWEKTPHGRLALVVLYDQFSRNMFRDTPRAFAQDTLARDLAIEAIDAGDERILAPMERYFLYMPLMHAEDVDLQRRCVACFERLANEAPPEKRGTFDHALKYARMHADIVERFGRFPHRNAILGRATTKEEAEFLTQPGSSF
jgi:uncharacterized protein (DUF924 family)